MDIDNFEWTTHQACQQIGGDKLRKWIAYVDAKKNQQTASKVGSCCPLLARYRLSISNAQLTQNQYWSFAEGFDQSKIGHPPNISLEQEMFDLGTKFRTRVLNGDYDKVDE